MKPASALDAKKMHLPSLLVHSSLNHAKQQGFNTDKLRKSIKLSFENSRILPESVSHSKIKAVLIGVKKLTNDPALGLTIGSKQSVLSFGLPGLMMLTCRTLLEALNITSLHQNEISAHVISKNWNNGNEIFFEVTPRHHDRDLDIFFIEQAFSSIALVRNLIGSQYKPSHIEVTYSKPDYFDKYQSFFQCPVKYSAPKNILINDLTLFTNTLPHYDDIACPILMSQLESLAPPASNTEDLLKFLLAHFRAHLDKGLDSKSAADKLQITDRTLRRRLKAMNLSYHELLDPVRLEQANHLLKQTSLSIREISSKLGLSDPRSFRRAFMRWSGESVSSIRAMVKPKIKAETL